MPDWTYHPLAPAATAAFGAHTTRIMAMRFLAAVVTRCGGRYWIPPVFGYPAVPQDWVGRFGATVPLSIAREAITVLPVQGATVVEVGPLSRADVATLAAATAGRRCHVTAVVESDDDVDHVLPLVDEVTVGYSPEVLRLTDPEIASAVDVLTDPDDPQWIVLAEPELLVAAGPGWFNRVIEAATPLSGEPPAPPRNPLRWPAWCWGVVVGIGMIVAGLGAAELQLSRLALAGNMIGIGVLYTGLSWGGIRRGWPWSRRTMFISALFTLPSILFSQGDVPTDVARTLMVAALVPMLVAAVWHRPYPPRWRPLPEGPEPQRRRALRGQLVMIGVGGVLTASGVVIAAPLTSHDRLGLGGSLIGFGLAVLLISLWGWRRGERWVLWTLALGCACVTAPALLACVAEGSVIRLLSVCVLVAGIAAALAVSRPYLTSSEHTRRRSDNVPPGA